MTIKTKGENFQINEMVYLSLVLFSGYNYSISVKTSDIDYAGTNANVYITLYGEVANSQEEFLSDPNIYDPFERNSRDNFKIMTNTRLGDITLCQIRRTDTGRAAGWHLLDIYVGDLTTGKRYYCHFDQWITLSANASALVSACPNNKIGQRCITECRCQKVSGYTYACYSNGYCTAPGAVCLEGWFGKTCQKKKLNRSVYVSASTGTSKDITDGNDGTFADILCDATYKLGVNRTSLQTSNRMIVEFLANGFDNNIRTYVCMSNSALLYQTGSAPGAICYYIYFHDRKTYHVYGNSQYMSLKCYGSNYLRVYEVDVFECGHGTFGEDCSEICDYCINQNCNGTGHCLNGCISGATEAKCITCPTNCKCNLGTDVCVSCETGWYRENCQWRCHRNCRNFQCNKITGRCLACDTTRSYYGDMCQNICPQNCDYNGCHRDLGTCIKCIQGYHGAVCNKTCPTNCVTCTNHTLCTECKVSWVGDICDCKKDETAGQCNTRVPKPMTSTSTPHTCNVVNCKECSINTTSCKTCVDGFHGLNCDASCSSGCVESGCNRTTAECLWGCNQGWDGPKCDQAMGLKDDDHAKVIVGSVVGVGVLVLVIIIILIVAIVIRRKRKKGKSSNYTNKQKMSDLLQKEENRQSGGKSCVQHQNIDVPANIALLPKTIPRPSTVSLEELESGVDSEEPIIVNASEYYNFSKGQAVSVDGLWEHIQQKKAKTLFGEEYNSIPNGLLEEVSVATKSENASKNRYKGIYPYDHNRVVLAKGTEISDSDYINASYVNGFNMDKFYIAAMGPFKDETVVDFWRMIWQTNTIKVVMLTNLIEEEKEKCKKYWPDESETTEYGDIKVRCTGQQVLASHTVRNFDLWKGNEKGKSLVQFHFTVWPDRDVPRNVTAIVEFRNKVRKTKTPEDGPTIVHCSAGIGRTGTYIALDYLIDEGESTKYVNIIDCVTSLRHQRAKAIQTSEQYEFVHDALVEALNGGRSTVPTDQFHSYYRDLMTKNRATGKSKLQEQYELLVKLSPVFSNEDFTTAKITHNKDKHRYSNIAAADRYRIFLNPSTLDETQSDYINAIFLPAYKERYAFLLTEMPLPNTVVAFWQMILQESTSSVIMLNNIKKDQSFGTYWPIGEKEADFGPFHVTLLEKDSGNGPFDILTMKVTLDTGREIIERKIKQFQCKFWPGDAICPPKPHPMLELMESVMSWQRQTGNNPTVVHCMNGAKQSGLYCALFAIIERLRTEHEVSVFQTILQLRTRRGQIIPNKEQLEFCYETVLAYLETFNTYSNFSWQG